MTSSTSSPKHVLEFRNVSIAFDDKPVLTDLSFRLYRGEMIFVTGESGSGKSVLLRMAMGLLKPDSGQIFVGGREIETLNESELLGIRGGLMGMVFQEESLFSGLTVYENAAFRLEDHGWTPPDVEKAVSEVLRFVGLDGEETKLPGQLSGGMKRRLEIARALIGWPSIMLFDEPAMGLDPIVAVQVLDLIIRARDINKISSIYVTKNPREISYLGTYVADKDERNEVVIHEATPSNQATIRIMVLEAGKVAFTGGLAEFQDSDLLCVRRLLTLDQHDHSVDHYFTDPWDKSRHPREKLL